MPSTSANVKVRPSSARRARARLLRRFKAIGALLIPAAWIIGTDFLRRGRYIVGFDRPHKLGYAGYAVATIVLWAVLLYSASRRRGLPSALFGALFVGLFTLAAGVQGAFHWFYNIYLSMDGQIHSKSIPWSIVGTLPVERLFFSVHMALALGVALAALHLARRFVRPTIWPRHIVPIFVAPLLSVPFFIPVHLISYRTVQSTTSDWLYLQGFAALIKEQLGYTHDSPDLRVQRRSPEPVPALHPKPSKPRNVLLIVQESQRADVTCIDYEADCDLATPFSNKAVPNRFPLRQLRANASTTAISIGNIWSGVRPTERRDTLHSVPLMWEYAHAAGWDTAYWTSQNLMFGNARLFVQDLPLSHRCVATNVDTQADLDAGASDMLVTNRVIEEWGELKEPFFAVVHYSNIHWPYVYDENHAPFQPSELNKSPEKNEEFKNYYKNVVYLSDMAVGKLLEHIRSTESGSRTVIAYTSDHGEAFREHWQLGHTSALYDEEIHVPGWIDAPEGTLTDDEAKSLRAAKDEFVWHLDLAPTMLDLMGLWDDPTMTPYRSRMMGHPLTRRERTVEPVPLTNCTWLWECAFRNWGMMQGPMKLEAREWDAEYHCFNIVEDPDELRNLGEQACAPMPDLARALYHTMPNVTPPGRPVVDWGKK